MLVTIIIIAVAFIGAQLSGNLNGNFNISKIMNIKLFNKFINNKEKSNENGTMNKKKTRQINLHKWIKHKI